jgi:hypothetical protein
MSVEKKIRELLESKKARQQVQEAAGSEPQQMQGSSQKADYTEIDPHSGAAVVKTDSTVKKGPAEGQVMQGSSKKAEMSAVDPHAAASTSKTAEPTNTGAGSATNYTNTVDPATVVNQPNSKGNTWQEETQSDEVTITEEDLEETAEVTEPRKIDMALEDLRKDIASVFAADTNLSEEFKTQASSIFEAAVIARVNNEVEKITSELAEQAATEINTIKEGLVEKIDTYLNYVVEQWMEENELAVDNGLRTEVAEDFMLGLKNLFQEHYFEVPEDKIDVLEDMTQKMDNAAAKLDEAIQVNIGLKTELDAIKRDRIVAEACRNLTATDAEKLGKLLEGVDFGDEKLFTEKVKVVKENYFPAGVMTSPEQTLEEEVQNGTNPAATANPIMERYVQAIGRSVKK